MKKNHNKLIFALISIVLLILALLCMYLNPQLFNSHKEQINGVITLPKIRVYSNSPIPTPNLFIETAMNSPIPTPTPNPCDYEISFASSPEILVGSKIIKGDGVPGTAIQVWNGNDGTLIGEAIVKKNGKFTINRIRTLREGMRLLLTVKHNNAIYTSAMVTGTGYYLRDFGCLLTDQTAANIPVYRYIFQVYLVPARGILP